MEKLDFLIKYLLKENKEVKVEKIPEDIVSKKRLYRSLCNIRDVKPISEEYLKVENEYLQEELKNKVITDVSNIEVLGKDFPESKICLWQGDITKLKIETIVNAGNSGGVGCFIPLHSCIDNNIHSASGVSLRLECGKVMEQIGALETGKAFITKGYNLPSKYVIHTVGPIIYDFVTKEKEEDLANCYINSLKIAKEHNIKTIAFPCISTGEFHFPKDLASKIAIKAVKEFLNENKESFDKIVFNVFTDEDYEIYKNNLKEG